MSAAGCLPVYAGACRPNKLPYSWTNGSYSLHSIYDKTVIQVNYLPVTCNRYATNTDLIINPNAIPSTINLSVSLKIITAVVVLNSKYSVY